MERSCTRSLEEENELVRSTKKVKDSHNGITEGSPGRCEGSFHANKLSFKEKLVGEIPGVYSQSLAFSEQMEAESESDEETEDIREGFATTRPLKRDMFVHHQIFGISTEGIFCA